MIEMTGEYDAFLARAVAAIVAGGAQVMLPDPQGRPGAPWAAGWDRILLAETPGASTIYALTDGDGVSREVLAKRINELAGGIGTSGLLRQPSLRLVSVIVFPHGLAGKKPREYTRLGPTTFFSGLRPSTWVIDLPAGQAFTGRSLNPDGRDLLARAAAPGMAGDVLDAGGVAVLEREHSERLAAFYQLMRGRQPVVTYALLAINILVFLLLYTNGGPENGATLQRFGALEPRLIEQGEWWRMFTSIFLHASVPHILFNMTSLFAVGTLAERLYGSSRYLAIYLGSGLIGSVVSFLYEVATNHLDILGVGASGAIFGVAGALLTVRFQRSDIIPLRLRTRISTSLLPLVAISLVFSFLTPYVDNSAHIGGLIGGAALSFAFPLARSLPVSGRS